MHSQARGFAYRRVWAAKLLAKPSLS